MKFFLLLLTVFNINVYALEGRYDIPVSDETLLPYSQFSMQSSSIDYIAKEKLAFTLPPAMMTDQARVMEFYYNENTHTYISEHGSGDCFPLSENQIQCDMVYSKSYGDIIRDINPKMPEFLVNQLGFTGVKLEKTIEVLNAFAGDPIGTLIINYGL